MNAPTATITTVPQVAASTAPVKPLRVYIAGPMTGIADANYPAFHRAAALLRACGFEVESPAEAKPPADPTWLNWMRQAIPQMLSCDAVVVLPGHSESAGACAEVALANKLGLPVEHIERALCLMPQTQEEPEWLPGYPKARGR